MNEAIGNRGAPLRARTLALGAAAALAAGCHGVLDLRVKLVTRSCESDPVRAGAEDPFANVSQLRFTVYGKDIDSFALQTRVDLAALQATLFAIPAGKDRNIVAEALALPGDVVVARGETGPLDLTVAQSQLSVDIFLRRTDVFTPASGADAACAWMSSGRVGHTATLLADGRVLVAGGYDLTPGRAYRQAVEIFDPRTGTFGPPPAGPAGRKDLAYGRAYHSATAVPGTTLVILAGGEGADASGRDIVQATAEVFDSARNSFVGDPVPMRAGRTRHGAAIPPNLGRLLLAGGYDAQGRSLKTTETFDPGPMAFDDGPNLTDPRGDTTALGLPGGLVVVAGGYGASSVLKTLEMFQSRSTGSYDAVPGPAVNLTGARLRPLLAPLGPAGVLITGGFTDRTEPPYASSAESTEFLDLAAASPAVQATRIPAKKRGNGGIAALKDGTVLAGGGGKTSTTGGATSTLATADVFYANGEVTAAQVASRQASGDMKDGRALAAWTVLQDGSVLVTGGLMIDTAGPAALRTAEIFQPRYQTARDSPW